MCQLRIPFRAARNRLGQDAADVFRSNGRVFDASREIRQLYSFMTQQKSSQLVQFARWRSAAGNVRSNNVSHAGRLRTRLLLTFLRRVSPKLQGHLRQDFREVLPWSQRGTQFARFPTESGGEFLCLLTYLFSEAVGFPEKLLA